MTSFKYDFYRLIRWWLALFCVLFLFRILYGYSITETDQQNVGTDFFGSLDNVRKNYASEKRSYKSADVQQQATVASNQKYEKTASIKSKTSEFDRDENEIKDVIKTYQAIAQYEQKLGNKGNRELHLMIGVDPESFDAFYTDTQKIGIIKATEVTKVDKTNEYRRLNAKKASLIKNLESLTELKSHGGQIADFISLHDKIFEVETSLQELGVELGNFDAENEFCTVKLSLYEGIERKISLLHRVKVALEWSIKYSAVFGFILGGLLLLSSILNRIRNGK